MEWERVLNGVRECWMERYLNEEIAEWRDSWMEWESVEWSERVLNGGIVEWRDSWMEWESVEWSERVLNGEIFEWRDSWMEWESVEWRYSWMNRVLMKEESVEVRECWSKLLTVVGQGCLWVSVSVCECLRVATNRGWSGMSPSPGVASSPNTSRAMITSSCIFSATLIDSSTCSGVRVPYIIYNWWF